MNHLEENRIVPDHIVFFAGFGGQGIVIASQMLALAGMEDGLSVSVFTSYGPEQRGGTSLCITMLSEGEIYSPVGSTPTMLAALNQPSMDRYEPKVKSGGIVLANSSLVSTPPRRPGELRYLSVPCSSLATDLGDVRVANVVALGALASALGLVSPGAVRQAIRETFSSKSKSVLDLNLQALEKGINAFPAKAVS